ncbi:MAG: hypothetical protein ACLQPH_18880, partial [Acidimicrobiales bacterium]
MTADTLPIAHRVWAEVEATKAKKKARSRSRTSERRTAVTTEPSSVLFFDTETTTDPTQALNFGVWRYYRIESDGLTLVDEGILHADELAERYPTGLAVLREYAERHQSATGADLRLLSRSEFVDKVFFPAAYQARARVVGFNLPFDISRIAIGVTEARGDNLGGFSFILAAPKPGTPHKERKHRPRVVIKHLDSKGAFISFGKAMEPDASDLIPEGSPDQKPDKRYVWRGKFLDLR